MEKLFKFDQRARRINDGAEHYSFGIIIKQAGNRFAFIFVDGKGGLVRFINLNEWKIDSIWMEEYYSREKMFFKYSDPTGSEYILNSSGRTMPLTNAAVPSIPIDYSLDFIASEFLEMLLRHFHRISCFESVLSLKKEEEELRQANRLGNPDQFNHQYCSIWF
jgi:hypothetical protein